MTEAYFTLLSFIILMVATPGPANLIVMLGGAQIGLKRCAGFIVGLVCGKILLNILFGLGFGLLLVEQDWLAQLLKFISAGYMIFLAVRSWNDRPQSHGPATQAANQAATQAASQAASQFAFRHGVIVHPLNPKAWVMVILAWSNFAPPLGEFDTQLILVVVSFAVVQLFFHSLWCAAGQWLGTAMRGSQNLTRGLIILTVGVVIWALII